MNPTHLALAFVCTLVSTCTAAPLPQSPYGLQSTSFSAPQPPRFSGSNSFRQPSVPLPVLEGVGGAGLRAQSSPALMRPSGSVSGSVKPDYPAPLAQPLGFESLGFDPTQASDNGFASTSPPFTGLSSQYPQLDTLGSNMGMGWMDSPQVSREPSSTMPPFIQQSQNWYSGPGSNSGSGSRALSRSGSSGIQIGHLADFSGLGM